MSKQDKLSKKLGVSVVAATLAALPLAAGAAGLGKLTVLSALGQPLRAELDVSASREELSSLAARIAAQDAFRQANIEYASALAGLRFTLDKRPGGAPYFKISSDRPVGDPFLDMLVELSWSSGRLVREYTFLLDPPEMKVAEAPMPQVSAPVVGAQGEAPAAEPSEKPAAALAGKGQPKKKPEAAPIPKAEGAQTRTVRSGDTLAKIAAETKPEGVSLDQMLVALFRGNQDAFDGGNMNRLRAGKILSVPERDAVEAVDGREARKVVVAQSADFNAYKRKLAGAAATAPAKEAEPQQGTTGKITPKVEEKQAPAPAKDKLEVSRTEAGKAGAAAEDAIAKEKALKEAQSRINELEKNLADMRKLSELKSQAGADLQKQAKPADNALPAKAAPAPEAAKPPVEAAKPAETPPAETPPPAAPPVAAPPAKKKVLPPPPPPPEPSFLEENGMVVAGGAALLALLGGFFGFKAWKRRKGAAAATAADSVLSGGSVFGTAEGQSVDTGAAGPATDFGLSGSEGAEGDGVDPIREADTYMAYGRDAQAEEILLDALKKDPTHLAVYLKLLEIYAARKNVPQFNATAEGLHAQTGGSGAEWERAAILGRALDPSNPLWGGGSPETAPVEPVVGQADTEEPSANAVTALPQAEAAEPVAAEPSHEELPGTLDFDLDLGSPAAAPAATAEPAADEAAENVIDFDLDAGTAPQAASADASATEPAAGGLDIDFDLALDSSEPAPESATPAEAAPAADSNVISFDLDLGGSAAAPDVAPEPAPAAAPALDFDFDLGETPAVPTTEAPAPALDLSSINLDIGEPTPTPSAVAGNPEVTTKLELAQAYEEMGDKEGARELLNEVLAEGDADQQAAARDRLSKLS